MRIQFNTGRGYSASGQPITAVQYDSCVKFRDHARGITGTIPVAGSVRPMLASELQEFVMWNYDRNNYTDAHWTEDELVYEHPENPVGWNTWQRHFNHHLKTVYGVDAKEAGIDTCWLHNELYGTSERTLGSALECAYWYGNKYGLVVMNELDQSSTPPPSLTTEFPTEPGMYLMLYNLHTLLPSEVDKCGLDPEEHRFWEAAPVYFGPLEYAHTTYASELKYSYEGPHNGFEEEGYFPVIEDLLEVDGKYYGDWSVFIVKEQS